MYAKRLDSLAPDNLPACSRYAWERPTTPNIPGWFCWKEFSASLHQWTECGCKMRGDEAEAEVASMADKPSLYRWVRFSGDYRALE
jgi:hypothetical protein